MRHEPRLHAAGRPDLTFVSHFAVCSGWKSVYTPEISVSGRLSNQLAHVITNYLTIRRVPMSRSLILAILALLMISSTVLAQTATGILEGRVSDDSGAAVPDAKVT